MQSAVLLAVSECKRSYEARFRELRHQLQKQHSQEKDLLTQQVVQLEARLVECLRDRDYNGAKGAGDSNDGCGMGGAKVEAAFRTAADSLQSDIMALVSYTGFGKFLKCQLPIQGTAPFVALHSSFMAPSQHDCKLAPGYLFLV